MLALTRKVGERIVIRDDIVITVVDIKGENIRLAIEAPQEIKIYRGEIYDAIVNENKQAAAPAQAGVIEVLKDIKINRP
jgi:carbon storage regulator (csrA)